VIRLVEPPPLFDLFPLLFVKDVNMRTYRIPPLERVRLFLVRIRQLTS
jgi:hypothetical protein